MPLFSQSQYAEHRDRQHPQTRTSNPSERISPDVESCSDVLQSTSGDNVSADKSFLPTEAASSNLLHHQVMTRSSSSETNTQPVSVPQKIIVTRSKDSHQTQPLSKPATDARSFKPPFKAKQATRSSAVHFIPTITLADDPSSYPDMGLDEANKCSSSATVHIVKSSPPVTKESGTNVPQSPPFSPSSDIISNDEFLSEMTGVFIKKGNQDVLGDQEQSERQQEATCMRTMITPHPYPNLSARQNYAVNHGITDQPKQGSNVSPIHVHNTNHAIRTLDMGTISNSHVCVSSDQVNPQNVTFQSGCQPLEYQLMSQLQSINPSSSTGQGKVATSRSTLASSQPKKKIIISARHLNGSDNIRVLPVSTKSTTAPGIVSTMSTVSKATPVGLQHGTSSSKTQAASNRTQIAQSQTKSGALSNVIGTPGSLHYHIPTSNTTISASTSILPTAARMITVSAPQPLVSTVRTVANKTLYNQPTTGKLQGISPILPHTRPLASIQDEIRSDEQVPSLLDLLNKKLIEPGENVLMIKHKVSEGAIILVKLVKSFLK